MERKKIELQNSSEISLRKELLAVGCSEKQIQQVMKLRKGDQNLPSVFFPFVQVCTHKKSNSQNLIFSVQYIHACDISRVADLNLTLGKIQTVAKPVK